MAPPEASTCEITSPDGRVHAGVDVRGGGLRFLRVDGRPLVEEYPVGSPAPAAAGTVMFPWPNRVRDGRWTAGGTTHQLALTEPERGTANHGLVNGRLVDLARSGDDRLTAHLRVVDEPGYPFDLRLAVTYQACEDGLVVDTTVVNDGPDRAPCALGFHPYLRVGDASVEELRLTLAADRVVRLDERLLPVAVVPLAEGDLDPGDLALAGADLHACFRSVPGPDGSHVYRVSGPDSTGVEIRADADFRWVQLYTCADFPRAGATVRTVRAVALEPMTAPPDALSSGLDLRWVEPGEEWSLRWSLHAVGGAVDAVAASRADASSAPSRARPAQVP